MVKLSSNKMGTMLFFELTHNSDFNLDILNIVYRIFVVVSAGRHSENKSKQIALTIFGLNVQKDNSDLVLDGQTLVQQDGHYVAHVVTDFLTLCVLAHSQVLLNFAQFVHVALEKPFRLEIFFSNLAMFCLFAG